MYLFHKKFTTYLHMIIEHLILVHVGIVGIVGIVNSTNLHFHSYLWHVTYSIHNFEVSNATYTFWTISLTALSSFDVFLIDIFDCRTQFHTLFILSRTWSLLHHHHNIHYFQYSTILSWLISSCFITQSSLFNLYYLK